MCPVPSGFCSPAWESYELMLVNRMGWVQNVTCLFGLCCVLCTTSPCGSRLNSVVICEYRDHVMFSTHSEQQTLVSEH